MFRVITHSMLVAAVIVVPQVGSTAQAVEPVRAQAVAATSVPSFNGLTDLAVQRILIGDDVAASKYFSGKPVDDPVREQQILESVRASAVQLGIDPESTAEFFQAQIDASKVVQRGLLAYWAAHPTSAPTSGPDLNVIREQLDKLTTQLLAELVTVDHLRHSGLRCDVSLLVATTSEEIRHHLDRLHRQALHTAVRTVC
ncbi:gamma subclass chorismate mutase AroQ [Kribbella sp. NPDC051952]|uniref:gamma subclass chorismate mutase AroQ n=1 Tax=Kribbella sp. NPDC051952 TaxID=3154851 RepID=UPI0034395DFA